VPTPLAADAAAAALMAAAAAAEAQAERLAKLSLTDSGDVDVAAVCGVVLEGLDEDVLEYIV
jgi:hypothetical protein